MSSSCSRTVNNKYYNNPAIMSDGRAFTDYRSSREVNEMLAMRNNVQPSTLYQQFLIKNGAEFIDKYRDYNLNKLEMGTINSKTINNARTCEVNFNSRVFCTPYNESEYTIGTSWKSTAVQPVVKVPYKGDNKAIGEEEAFPMQFF